LVPVPCDPRGTVGLLLPLITELVVTRHEVKLVMQRDVAL